MDTQELKFDNITQVFHEKETFILPMLSIMRANGHVVNLVTFPINVILDFSNNLKYGICWNFDHVWVQQEED